MFKQTMPCDRFLHIRANLQLVPHNYYPGSEAKLALSDPLWKARPVIDQFLTHSANIAVPIGASALDENTIRTSGR